MIVCSVRCRAGFTLVDCTWIALLLCPSIYLDTESRECAPSAGCGEVLVPRLPPEVMYMLQHPWVQRTPGCMHYSAPGVRSDELFGIVISSLWDMHSSARNASGQDVQHK
ncbi:uncharacterized protein BO95DRAFT_61741 [Aspergillus brunneoviolaceus CBS 621.78]|uniref:Uncharacterized protein n=1 Tax=Aspergillus brunneoviolaceus CBS 621.78 TaxID=1450534 RepID=A0ACD1GG30_9EURO|nr:hypothetical protein BO95DRAFT_61741 [Aspergillus brunneoviolaceus CBS 621.78]RAH48269.1 hypothetical protein BO95DRAFT_61741 [Aspergillus brunneoviolaceus CBS 621.78]